MESGIIKGHYIDAKNLSVTDGNGKRTLDIDSYGNVETQSIEDFLNIFFIIDKILCQITHLI